MKKTIFKMDKDIEAKIVLVGDSGVGKSSLIQQFISNKISNAYIPTGFDKYTARYNVEGSFYCTKIYDTSGSPVYDTVRPLVYQNTDVFLLCFHLNHLYSLQNAQNKWNFEIRKYSKPEAVVILVGCQNDQREHQFQKLDDFYQLEPNSSLNSIVPYSGQIDDYKRRPVYTEDTLDICRQIGAETYLETCAYDPASVRKTFEFAALASNGKLQIAMQRSSKTKHNKFRFNSLLSVKTQSLSNSTTDASMISSCDSSLGSDSGNSLKLKLSINSTHFFTRHQSLFMLRRCKGDLGNKIKGKQEKSCVIL